MIVRGVAGESAAVRRLIRSSGGSIDAEVGILDGFIATVPIDRIDDLEAGDEVLSVTPNGQVQLATDTYDPASDINSVASAGESVTARQSWDRKAAGDGIGVVVIDTGVSRVKGLDGPGKVTYGPDFTPEAADPALANIDGYGHGTFMAGLIAANDLASPAGKPDAKNKTAYLGVAPNAKIISVKVGDRSGATAVASVIMGLDWVVQHAKDPSMNLRVVNLSFGTNSGQSYLLDPLAYSVERVWAAGIAVVVSAGNAGGATGAMTMPAQDPFIIAVGADHPMGTASTADDEIPTFSSRGDGIRNPDFVAPGVSLQGLRVPGSYIDREFGDVARLGSRFFRGSGTSQAAALVSGAIATMLSRNPRLTPDEVKALLIETAQPLPSADPQAQGAGLIDLAKAIKVRDPKKSAQKHWKAWGIGSLARSAGTWSGAGWDDSDWSGNRWTGNRWTGGTWGNTAASNRSMAGDANPAAWSGGGPWSEGGRG